MSLGRRFTSKLIGQRHVYCGALDSIRDYHSNDRLKVFTSAFFCGTDNVHLPKRRFIVSRTIRGSFIDDIATSLLSAAGVIVTESMTPLFSLLGSFKDLRI